MSYAFDISDESWKEVKQAMDALSGRDKKDKIALEKLAEYAELKEELDSLITIRQKALEKRIDAVKEELQEYCKENGEFSGSGYSVVASIRDSWPTEALKLYANSHPEINSLKKSTLVATIRKG